MSDTVVPVAWMHEDNLTSLKTGDGIVIATLSRNHYGAIKAAPLYSEATVTSLQSRIAELEADAALGAAVRPYFTSANDVPVDRVVIRRHDIGADAIYAAIKASK